MDVKFYQVGGSVRDGLLGVPSKDIDYAVEAPSFDVMVEAVRMKGEVFLSKPEYLTLRAKVGDTTADFVLCRKDGSYYDGRHPESVTPGTIYDDLARRDFTVNAMAIDEDKNLLDPHGGAKDLKGKIIRCVGTPEERFNEDGLRILRAIRFSITKDFSLDYKIVNLLCRPPFFAHALRNVSKERIREELVRCFRHDTLLTLNFFDRFRVLRNHLFSEREIWLEPTLKERK